MTDVAVTEALGELLSPSQVDSKRIIEGRPFAVDSA